MKTTRFFERLKLGLFRTVDTTEELPGMQGFVPVDGAGRPYVGGSMGANASPVFFERDNPIAPALAADMNISGGTAVAPIVFKIDPPSTEMWRIFAINITIADDSFDMTDFAGISGGLTNGIEMVARQNGTIIQRYTVAGYPIRTNPGLIQFSSSGPAVIFFGASNGILSLWVNMELTRRSFPELDGSAGIDLAFLIRDDLSSIIRFRALAFREVVTL